MPVLVRNGLIILACLAVALWAILPPEQKLRKGKDLAGGATLVYAVDVKPGDPPDTLTRVIEVLKQRIDPNGVLEISMVAQGSDRIEISMPLPSDRVKALRAEFDQKLVALAAVAVSAEDFDAVVALEPAARAAQFERMSGGDVERRARLDSAAAAFDALKPERAKMAALQRDVAQLRERVRAERAKAGGAEDRLVADLESALKLAEDKVRAEAAVIAPLDLAYESARESALTGGLNAGDLRRALTLSSAPTKIEGNDGKIVQLPSPRERAITEILTRYKEQETQIKGVIAAWDAYESQRRSLDDPNDIKRILRGAGVLNFRITVQSGEIAQEAEARSQLKTGGPRSVRVDDVAWYKVNKIENWLNSVADADELKASAATFFGRRGYIGEEYKGEYYILCWDRRDMRLTEQDGAWSLAAAYQGVDQVGRPAIDFRMDALGASKLGALTEGNVQKNMAVLLDDEIYTAPRLQSRIAGQGQITGNFSSAEREYVIRVLSAGSLQAKLSPEPIGQSVLGPQFGADNLDKGLKAGLISFVVVAAFMMCYYFAGGVIAVVALAFNAMLLVAAMALNQAAFTLPGIAGIMLTFGQAVDANVLIYERMREEFRRGADLRTAVRLGFDKAFSAIVDGNVTTLIVCVVLGFTGTQEIRGFALTLGIGIVTTLFAQLFFTRFIFAVMSEKLGIRKMSMLPTVIPGFQEAITPNVDWLKIRPIAITISIILTIASIGLVIYKGSDLLSAEFRGGTVVTLDLKTNPDGSQAKLDRPVVEERVKDIAAKAPEGSPLKQFVFAEVVAVNPDANGVTAPRFVVKTTVTDPEAVQAALVGAFGDVIESRPPIVFTGSAAREPGATAFPVISGSLAETIDRPATGEITEYVGGVAFVLDNLNPPTSLETLRARLEATRSQSDFSDTLGRRTKVVPLAGTPDAVTSAAVVVAGDGLSYLGDERSWSEQLRDREWRLIQTGLTQSQTLASVESFSPSVASTFQAQAITALVFSTLLVVIYIWVRFNSLRYSLAAIVTTLHDCVIAVGCVALATILFDRTPGLARTLGILPFKIDLNVMAAILTVLGFSLNGVIVVMDRVRENRGKLPYASRKAVNDAINQCFSRTIITTFTTLFAVVTLYVYGGDAVRVFAYTLLLGVISATYSAIGVAPTLVWSRAADKHAQEAGASAGSGAGGGGGMTAATPAA